jgi:hypothetical protein
MAIAPPSTPSRSVPSLGTPLPPDLERLARAWLRYVDGDAGAAAADELLRNAVESSALRAWMIVTRLVELADDRETCARIGAGPLEWTLERHGVSVSPWLERAVHDPHMRAALDAAWPRGLTPAIAARLRDLRGHPGAPSLGSGAARYRRRAAALDPAGPLCSNHGRRITVHAGWPDA